MEISYSNEQPNNIPGDTFAKYPANRESNFKKNIPLIFLGVIIGLVLVLAGIYFFVPRSTSDEIVSPIASIANKVQEARDVVAPLTGEYYSFAEAEEWIEERPFGVMVNNHVQARPQSGLIYADLVYEIVAEGGITRFLAFYHTNTPDKLGPIRSARHYYLVLVKELGDAMIMHHGWSPQALEAIETWPVRSLQRGNAPYWRDNPRNVPVEHTLYADGNELRATGDALGWGGVGVFDVWDFKEDEPVTPGSEENIENIIIDFWFAGDYSAIWQYNPESNTYKRFTGYSSPEVPIPHVDQETGEQVEVKNLIVQFAEESSIAGDNKGRLEYELVGSGTGFVFMDGKVYGVTWEKEGRDDRTFFFGEDGERFNFNRGKFWISIVPERNFDQVNYD